MPRQEKRGRSTIDDGGNRPRDARHRRLAEDRGRQQLSNRLRRVERARRRRRRDRDDAGLHVEPVAFGAERRVAGRGSAKDDSVSVA